jgi:lipopolysaccharide exporter
MIAFRMVERSLGLVSTLVLARLLLPGDFGLVAMAMSFIAFIELASAFGFDNALIQHASPERRHFDTAFTLNVILGLSCGAIMVGLAHAAAVFYDDERLVPVMYVLALAWTLQGFENIGTVTFRKELQFRREFQFLISKRLIAFVITLIAAFTLRSYWALVIGTVAGRMAMVGLSYAFHPYRPRFSLAAVRELMGFSIWILFNNALAFVNTRMSSFVIGRMHGPHSLGLYTVSYEIGTLPTSELLAPVNRAIFPGFTQIAHDPVQMRDGFLNVVAATTLFALPAAFGIAAVAEPLVIVTLSRKWIEVVPLLQVLAFLGAIAAMVNNAYPLFLALGRPRITTFLATARVGVLIPAMIFVGSHYGTLGVAWAELGCALLFLPANLTVLMRVLHVSFTAFLAAVWRPMMASVLMFLVVRAFLTWTGERWPDLPAIVSLLAGVLVGALTYIAGAGLLWRLFGSGKGVEAAIVRLVRERLIGPKA